MNAVHSGKFTAGEGSDFLLNRSGLVIASICKGLVRPGVMIADG